MSREIEDRGRRRGSRRATFVAVLVCAAGLAACGGSSSSSTSSAQATGSSSELSAAQAVVANVSKPQTSWAAPASSPPPAKNKTVVVIPCAAAASGCLLNVQGFQNAAKALGWKTTLIDPAGDPNKTHAAILSAIVLHANGIYLAGIEPTGSAGQITSAEKAGIKVFASASGSSIVNDEIGVDPVGQGQTIGAYIAVATQGKGHILFLNDPDSSTITQRLAGTKSALKKYCPNCTSITSQFTLAQIGTTLGQQVKATLQAHPDINMVWLPFDGIAGVVEPAIKQLGASKIHMVGFDATAQSVGYIAKGDVQTASMAAPPAWAGWAGAYEMNRLFGGEKVLANDALPSRLILRTNASQIGGNYNGDVDYQGIYKKLWQTASQSK